MRPVESSIESPIELSIVMPCLNEAETLATCISKARAAFEENGIIGEVIIADNGSNDGSQGIAHNMGAQVVPVEQKGYGAALMGGIAAARGRFVMVGDADDSYNFGDAPIFLAELRKGSGLVIGNRFRGGIQPGAMPVLHRYLGNPVLSWLGRLFFAAPCTDFHCGLRAFTKAAYGQMDLRTTGMEFASEMVVKASLFGIKISEVPTTLSPDGRSRPPHLHTWRDGWRHLRFLLLYSPRWLFLYPGFMLIVLGFAGCAWLLPGPRIVHGIVFDVHTLLYAFAFLLLGFQLTTFAVFTKIFAISEGLLPEDPNLDRVFHFVRLETGLCIGFLLAAVGMAGSILAVTGWSKQSFGPLDFDRMLRLVMPSAFSLALGVQIICSSFFLSVLGLRRR